MKLFKFLNRPNYSTLQIPEADRVKELLNQHLTPMLKELGLDNWNNNYLWFGEFNEQDIKPVFQFVRLKGLKATFTYGNCFKFVPTISDSEKVSNHRTHKSTALHLFERTEGWHNSFNDDKDKSNDYITLWNEKEFEKSLVRLRDKYAPILKKWYLNNRTIEQNIRTAKYQIDQGNAYNINWPNQQHILAFLYAYHGELSKADQSLDNFFKRHTHLSENLENTIRRKLEKIKTGANNK